jgi:hypothetical protein
LLAPLTIWPAQTAFWAWTAVQAMSLAAVLWLTWRLIGKRLPPRAWWWVGAATLASATVFWHFFFGHATVAGGVAIDGVCAATG